MGKVGFFGSPGGSPSNCSGGRGSCRATFPVMLGAHEAGRPGVKPRFFAPLSMTTGGRGSCRAISPL
ncbi:MAG: hypothetical protein NZ741_13050, partial [Armatimonadetes bacterium]|nr:hypothetical protein [Armatimonadota bacterium]